MIDVDSPTGERCRNCGRFCGVKYEWRGASYAEVEYCPSCEEGNDDE